MTQYVDSTSAVDPGFINADTGAPAYDAAELRRLFGGLIRADDPADPLAVRPGVLSAGSLVVSLDGSTIEVEPGPCVVGTVADGAYLTGLSAQNAELTLEAADLADPRKDRVSLQVLDDDIDAGGERKAQIVYESGVPGSGVYPDLPDNALSLAKVDVPVSGGGAAVVTDDRDRTGGAGTILWVPTTTVRDTLTAHSSTDNPLVVYVKATGLFQVSDDGATWETLATKEYVDAAIASGDVAWTNVVLGAGWANAAPWTQVRYRRKHGRVSVQGRITGTGGVANVIFTLPVGCRPSADAIDGAGNDYLVWQADASGTAVRLTVKTDGAVSVITAGAITAVSLAPIIFDAD